MIHFGKVKVRTVRWIEWIRNRTFLIFYFEFFLLGKRKNAISKSKDLNFTLQKKFLSFVIRVEEV
jgi:hypothetical protein